ncbi:unnamed protein product [Caenorhabditis bovis]|uniref:Uncharacterized protein n=1 Tax=Caenorhabditis bovis TaxID=2654633 RepID=A0A8S1FFD1_9PELO|nr:unnamed protein product [Caenorhabditis bovis]
MESIRFNQSILNDHNCDNQIVSSSSDSNLVEMMDVSDDVMPNTHSKHVAPRRPICGWKRQYEEGPSATSKRLRLETQQQQGFANLPNFLRTGSFPMPTIEQQLFPTSPRFRSPPPVIHEPLSLTKCNIIDRGKILISFIFDFDSNPIRMLNERVFRTVNNVHSYTETFFINSLIRIFNEMESPYEYRSSILKTVIGAISHAKLG